MMKYKKLGPGLLFAGAAIGVSHLVQSTRAGAEYGLTLLWAIILANLFKRKTLTFNFFEMFKPDDVLGDHYYRCSDYHFLFNSMNYSLKLEKMRNGKVIYVADKMP